MTRRPVLRRLSIGLVALAFGSGALWIGLHASESATPDQRVGALLGPLDLQLYCRGQYGDRAVAVSTRLDAYGWQCTFAVSGFLHFEKIEPDDACKALYDGSTYSDLSDSRVASSWRCLRGPKP